MKDVKAAKKLGFEFKDADTEIEKAAGRTVADIFADYGEEEFRRLEEKVIARLLTEGQIVLALGGGAFVSETTRREIAKLGLSVWLDVDLDTLHERVMRKPGKRPLLANGNPREILKNLMEKRNPAYSLADLQVKSISGTKSQMRDHLVTSLDVFLAEKNLRRQQNDAT